jgi:hypothetical protein
MITVINALQGAESLLLTMVRLWSVAGEIVTAGALLLALDRLAAAIRWTYRAGCFCGRLLWPAIHWIAGVLQLIDWREVAAVVIGCLKVLVAFAITAAQAAQPALVKASECLGRAYACLLVEPAAASLVAPAVNPLMALAEELEQLTCSQLRQITGTRSKLAKRQLVALALAC